MRKASRKGSGDRKVYLQYDIDMQWLPVAAVVGMLGVSRQRVHQLIGDGALLGARVSGVWLVERRSVAARILAKGTRGGR